MSDISLLDAARAIVKMWDGPDYALKMKPCVDDLRAAIEREEQREWKPGDKAVVNHTGQLVIVGRPFHQVTPEDRNLWGWTADDTLLRRPTPEELENWPGGEE